MIKIQYILALFMMTTRIGSCSAFVVDSGFRRTTTMKNSKITTVPKLVPMDSLDIMTTTTTTTTSQSTEVLINSFGSFMNSIIVATTDSDIAQMSDNEFRPVFMGGIVVMLGGLLSALVVGTIIDSKNLYANLVADSYADGTNDEEFWKGLSETEKVQAQELLRKVRESSNTNNNNKPAILTTTTSTDPVTTVVATTTTAAASTEVSSSTKRTTSSSDSTTGSTQPSTTNDKGAGIFSDY